MFAPYTDIPANLIFFNRQGPTRDIWYYELPPPEGRKKYSKTAPIQYEEFADCLSWWDNREENAQAWRIDFAKLHEVAKSKAEPFWQQAEQERQTVTEVGKQIRQLELQLNGLTELSEKAAIQDQQKELKSRQRQHEENAKTAQREGDAIYWPIYNLDIKNPHGKEALEHVPPHELVASMLAKEQDVIKLLAEIDALVNEADT